jgi:hypothetical protein
MVLTWLAILWGIILLFPGNTFAPPSQVGALGFYAEDWVWGSLLLLVSFPLFFLRRPKYRYIHQAAHAFYWIFWLGISVLVMARFTANGIQPTDFLITSAFVAIALIHGIIYIRLSQKL